jgi:hypothetical protein
MQRFKKFIDQSLNLENIKNSDQLSAFGITCTTLPDPPEEFDEFEFKTGFSEQMDVVIGVAIEMGKVKRILLGLSEKNDPDSFIALSESQLEEFLTQRGDQLVGFFEFIAQ